MEATSAPLWWQKTREVILLLFIFKIHLELVFLPHHLPFNA